MINPGVITLSKKTIGNQVAVIEDNIGESIHFHYGNIRVDMSISEFFETADIFLYAAKELIGKNSVEVFNYDPVFLLFISEHLSDLIEIRDDEIDLKKLVVYSRVTKNDYGWTFLNKSMMFRALNGDANDYEKYQQDNQPFMTNIERLNSVFSLVNDRMNEIGDIVLLNDTNIILDGQHRASCLLKCYGNISVKVKRFVFCKYDIKYKIHSHFYYFIKNVLRKIKKLLGRVLCSFQ